MKGTLTTIKANGQIVREEVDNANILDKLQAAVGGYIEPVPYFELYEGSRAIAYCNEEGKIDGLHYNDKATSAWKTALKGRPLFDVLVGDVVIVQGDDEFMKAQ